MCHTFPYLVCHSGIQRASGLVFGNEGQIYLAAVPQMAGLSVRQRQKSLSSAPRHRLGPHSTLQGGHLGDRGQLGRLGKNACFFVLLLA